MSIHKNKSKTDVYSNNLLEKSVQKDILEIKVLEEIIASEPNGKQICDIDYIKNASGSSKTIVSQKIGRVCRKLESKHYIYKKNKQAPYHITAKVFGYTGLTGWVFAQKTSISNDYIARQSLTLSELGYRLAAKILYILIYSLRPKKFYLDKKKDLIDLNVPVKGQDKDNVLTLGWIKNAIRPDILLEEFCSLKLIETSLPVFSKIHPSSSLPLEIENIYKMKKIPMDASIPQQIQKQFLKQEQKIKEHNSNNIFWSRFEMDENSYKELVLEYQKAFPGDFERFEKLRSDAYDDVAWYGEEVARKTKGRNLKLLFAELNYQSKRN